MITLTDKDQIKNCKRLLAPMIDRGGHFALQWLRSRHWVVAPEESAARLAEHEIPRVVKALNNAGFAECLAITTEESEELFSCHVVSISERGLRDLNRQLGVLRFVLTTEQRMWAILCTEWYNLFAGDRSIIEAMLGKSITTVQEEYLRYATLISQDENDPLIQVGRRYAVFR
jgi:hypothetical protein